MSLAFDENGRPFIILREQEKKKRVKGLEAHKVRQILFRIKRCKNITELLCNCLLLKLLVQFAQKSVVPKLKNLTLTLDQHHGRSYCS